MCGFELSYATSWHVLQSGLSPFATADFCCQTWNAPGASLHFSRDFLSPCQITVISDSLVLIFWHALRFSFKKNPIYPRRNRYGP
jgi:hypothetical protein